MKKKSWLAIVLALVLCIGCGITAYASSEVVTYEGNVYSYYSDGSRPDLNKHGIFRGEGGKPVFCGAHGIPTPMGQVGSSVTLEKIECGNSMVRKILYYGYDGPQQWSGFNNPEYNKPYNEPDKSMQCGVAVVGMALTRAVGSKGSWFDISGLREFWNFCENSAEPPVNFIAYQMPSGSLATQDLYTWDLREIPKPQEVTGSVVIEKASSVSVDDFSQQLYSLKGAQYKLYDQDGNELALMEIGENGKSNVVDGLKAGNYYIQEVKAPSGYLLDGEKHSFKIVEGEEQSLNQVIKVDDKPAFLTLDVLLKKQAKFDENAPVYSATSKNDSLGVAGALFKVSYFGQLLDDVTSHTPDRVWMVETDAKGVAALSAEYIKSGDKPFMIDGRVVAPIGTYLIEEVRSPAGFKVSKEKILRQVKQASEGAVATYVTPVIEEEYTPTTIKVNKIDSESKTNISKGFGTLSGATYEVWYLGENTKASKPVLAGTIVTDSEGKGQLSGLKNGSYKVKEVKPSQGYGLDSKEYIVESTKGNLIDDTIVVHVESQEIENTLKVRKTSMVDSNLPVKGATLVLMDSGKNEIHRWQTNEAEHIIYGLKPGVYYIGEEKTPDGYLPMTAPIAFNVKDGETKVIVENEPVPLVKTEASMGTKDGEDYVEITDKVTFENLVKGKLYKIEGKVVDKLNPANVFARSELEFTPNSANGSQNLIYKIKKNTLGKTTMVVFERLYRLDREGDKLVASHENINDSKQTVLYTPKDSSKVTPEGSNNITKPKNKEVVDTGDQNDFNLFVIEAIFAIALVWVFAWKKTRVLGENNIHK